MDVGNIDRGTPHSGGISQHLATRKRDRLEQTAFLPIAQRVEFQRHRIAYLEIGAVADTPEAWLSALVAVWSLVQPTRAAVLARSARMPSLPPFIG